MIELYDNLRKTLSEKVSILAINHIVCQLSIHDTIMNYIEMTLVCLGQYILCRQK